MPQQFLRLLRIYIIPEKRNVNANKPKPKPYSNVNKSSFSLPQMINKKRGTSISMLIKTEVSTATISDGRFKPLPGAI